MEVKVTDRQFPSTDGKHMLKGKMYLPEGAPIGIFHVVHGMTEHIGRYDSFLREMCASGYVCVAYDNLGHGNTATDDSELGYIAKKNGWKLLAADVNAVADIVKAEYPGLPYYLMGHSMGSFIVRLAAVQYPHLADKLIVMGTGGPNPASGVALGLINTIKLFRGERHISPMIENLAFGEYNKGFGESNGDWLSKNPEVRRVYDADKFCNYHFTVSAMHDLVKLNHTVNRKKWFKKAGKSKLPMLLLSGAEDPVGEHSKGVSKVFANLKKKGANVRMKLYTDNRHEILNDTAREETIADIKAFLNE